MSFRKNNHHREAKLKWKRFCEANWDLIERTDLPTPVIETEERFAGFLMHGYIDHHDDWSDFSISKMDAGQYKVFLVLVDKYFEAGYFDPGLLAVSHEERIRLARKYPQQFDPSFAEIIARQDEENA
jgi:hypothetical protein